MKKILLAAVALLSLTQAAHAAQLNSMNCVANNGVTMKGSNPTLFGLPVETHWGIFRKDFLAKLSSKQRSDALVINLDTKTATEYTIELSSLKGGFRALKATGTILQQSTVRGQEPTPVALVHCELSIK